MSRILIIDGDLLVYKAGFAHRAKELAFKLTNRTTAQEVDLGHISQSVALKQARELGYSKEEWKLSPYYEPEPLQYVLGNLRTMIMGILNDLKSDQYEIYLTSTDRSNYRYDIATIQPYKGSRARCIICYSKTSADFNSDKETILKCPECGIIDSALTASDRPYYFNEIRDYLVENWHAQVISGEEADDAVGIRYTHCTKYYSEPILVHIDKDINNVPGVHYNPDTKTMYLVSQAEATHHFYSQILIGDKIDNIPGVPGCGPQTAEKILKHCNTPEQYEDTIMDVFKGKHFDITRFNKLHKMSLSSDDAYQRLREVGQLLWIRQKSGELWEPRPIWYTYVDKDLLYKKEQGG